MQTVDGFLTLLLTVYSTGYNSKQTAHMPMSDLHYCRRSLEQTDPAAGLDDFSPGCVFSHWALSLCLDSFLFMFVFFCVYLVILHFCCIIVTRWCGPGGIEA